MKNDVGLQTDSDKIGILAFRHFDHLAFCRGPNAHLILSLLFKSITDRKQKTAVQMTGTKIPATGRKTPP